MREKQALSLKGITDFMLNVIEMATIERRIGRVIEKIEEVELFLAGNPISVIRIKDASITTAEIADLSITNAKFGDLAITNAKFGSVDAAKFTAGTISADRIGAGTITADKISVSTLSAISVNAGTITAGFLTSVTVTGGTMRTATSGSRIEVTASPNALIIYNSSGDEKVRFATEGMLIRADNNIMVGFQTIGGSGVAHLNSDSSSTVFNLGGESGVVITIENSTSGGDINFTAADGEVRLRGVDVTVNGSSKSAIVPTSQGYNALYCLESPEVWFFDFAKDIDSIDSLFLEVTHGEINALNTEQGELLVFRKRKVDAKRFASRTVEQFNRNNDFWGVV